MKFLKKTVALVLAFTMIFGCCSAFSCFAGQTGQIKFAVAADIHSEEKHDSIPVNFPDNELYFHAANSGNLYDETIGILVTFLNQAKEQGADFVLLAGDMTNSGKEIQHKYLASVLSDFEKESGIQVYITPGNHDCFNSTPEEIKNYYYDFGYDEAICVDEKTASYVVDLPEKYRLISVDSNNPGQNGDGIDDRLFDWIKAQAEKSAEDGKIPMVLMHHPVLEPVPFAELIMKDFIVRDHEDVAEKFTQWGIPYVFSGHEHGNNITSFTGSNGKVLYDILTTALTSYPLEYRMIDLDDSGMNVKCNRITECNFDYVTGGYNEAQLELMKSDYTEYSRGYFKYSIEEKIHKYTSAPFLENKLKVTDGPIYDALELVMPLVDKALRMPLYSKDSNGESVQSLAKECGVTLPESEYYNLYDLATSVVCDIYYGNENIPFEKSPEGKVLVVGLNTMLKYLLAEIGNQSVTLALNSAASVFGLDKIEEVDIFRWNRALVLGADNTYEVAYSVLSPLLNKFLLDDEIPDRDAFLPAPGETREVKSGFETFIDKLIAFFEYLFNVFKTILHIN